MNPSTAPSDDLVVLIRRVLEAEEQLADGTPTHGTEAQNQKAEVLKAIQSAMSTVDRFERGEKAARREWPLNQERVDVMMMDFMAPVLRGLLTPLSNRGDTLEDYWQWRFRWPSGSFRAAKNTPLLLMNACNTSWGTRFIVGYPSLPREFFESQIGVDGQSTRFPMRSHADLPNPPSVTLSQAVRLSSNFPWGFRVRRLKGDDEGDQYVNLLDGGMVDNTGMDTLHEVIRALYFHRDDAGRELLRRIGRRGVVLVEIDSGSKPLGRRLETSHAAGLFEPLSTLNNALYTNADVVKTFYADRIDQYLTQAVLEPFEQVIEEHPEEAPIEFREVVVDPPPLVLHYVFQSQRFLVADDLLEHAENATEHQQVMTAWALGTEEKARVVSRFLFEREFWVPKVAQVEEDIAEAVGLFYELDQERIHFLAERTGSEFSVEVEHFAENPDPEHVERIADLIAQGERLHEQSIPTNDVKSAEPLEIVRLPADALRWNALSPDELGRLDKAELMRVAEEAKLNTQAVDGGEERRADTLRKLKTASKRLRERQSELTSKARFVEQMAN